jgi:hypothetical protein
MIKPLSFCRRRRGAINGLSDFYAISGFSFVVVVVVVTSGHEEVDSSNVLTGAGAVAVKSHPCREIEYVQCNFYSFDSYS